jgi:hypothetical protein
MPTNKEPARVPGDQEAKQTVVSEVSPAYEKDATWYKNIGQPAQGNLFSPLNITIFDKLGQPERFRRPAKIVPHSIQQELAALRKLMLENRIQLMVSSPNINDADLFQFLTGEFMDIRITDDGSPLFHCFLYDDYRPDPFFDNEQAALNRCIRLILDKSLPCPEDLYMDELTLNQYGLLRKENAFHIIQEFKSHYDDIVVLEINPGSTSIHDLVCEVSGSHTTGFIRGNKCLLRTGRWNVRFGLNDKAEWKVEAVRIEDVDL